MSALETSFLQSADNVKRLSKTPTNEEMLETYALYKQATVGDNNTPAPGFLDLKGKAKWNKWNEKKGISKDSAKQQYINLVAELNRKYK